MKICLTNSSNGFILYGSFFEEATKQINNYFNTHHDGYEAFHKDNYIQNQTHELILEYNRRMKDNVNYPNKDQVRLWYSHQSQMLINEGAFSFSFLYPDFMGSIEELEKIYKKVN